MSNWSQAEITRTIEEVKRRAAVEIEFRALALSDPIAALAKVNPRPFNEGNIRFVESSDSRRPGGEEKILWIILPEFGLAEGELTDDVLEEVSGGTQSTTTTTTPPPPPPVDFS